MHVCMSGVDRVGNARVGKNGGGVLGHASAFKVLVSTCPRTVG